MAGARRHAGGRSGPGGRQLSRRALSFDQGRLERFDTVRREAIAAARARGKPEDVAVLNQVLKGRRLPFPRRAWRATGAAAF
ncbi:hypothetical protein ACFQU7_02985 [Pseudoroseomonas wenyumeiae]